MIARQMFMEDGALSAPVILDEVSNILLDYYSSWDGGYANSFTLSSSTISSDASYITVEIPGYGPILNDGSCLCHWREDITYSQPM